MSKLSVSCEDFIFFKMRSISLCFSYIFLLKCWNSFFSSVTSLRISSSTSVLSCRLPSKLLQTVTASRKSILIHFFVENIP